MAAERLSAAVANNKETLIFIPITFIFTILKNHCLVNEDAFIGFEQIN